MIEITVAGLIIISALAGGLAGSSIMVIYDRSARKRALEELRYKHNLND